LSFSHAVPIKSEQSVDVTPVVSLASSLVILPKSEQIVDITPAVSHVVSPCRPGPILSSSLPGSSSVSPPGPNLYVHLSQFSLQQATASESSTPPLVAHTHSKVLRPHVSKTTNFSVSFASWVASLPHQEPFSFKDTNRYLI